jgi:prepilin-type N-terminal cleavage/methylation domain-containing protein
MNAASTGRDGFTLVELLLAMTLTAVVAMASLGALSLFVEADSKAVQDTEQCLDVARALQLFGRDVRAATNLTVAAQSWTLDCADGTVIVYSKSVDSAALHRLTGASAGALATQLGTLSLAVAGAPQYSTRGHQQDSSWSSTALVQGARAIVVTPLNSSRDTTLIGLQLEVTFAGPDGDQSAACSAVCRALAETRAKP